MANGPNVWWISLTSVNWSDIDGIRLAAVTNVGVVGVELVGPDVGAVVDVGTPFGGREPADCWPAAAAAAARLLLVWLCWAAS